MAIGNVGNAELKHVLDANIQVLDDALASHRFVELGRDSLVIHG